MNSIFFSQLIRIFLKYSYYWDFVYVIYVFDQINFRLKTLGLPCCLGVVIMEFKLLFISYHCFDDVLKTVSYIK